MSTTAKEVKELFAMPFMDLLYKSHSVHRDNFDPNLIHIHTLLSVKTGGCTEDCAYCPQSAHHKTGVKKQSLMTLDEVIKAAKKAKSNGANRFCISCSGFSQNEEDFRKIVQMVKKVKLLGLGVCATLGKLTARQIEFLEEAGLDSYNHNLDTSAEYYKRIVTTHSYQDQIDTLIKINNSSIKICCGGIIGMNETLDDRIEFLLQLANLPVKLTMVPINLLIKIKGTPLERAKDIDFFAFVRVIAVARIILPKSLIALAAGRNEMGNEAQALAFFAGANVIHCGEKLLVTPLPNENKDKELLKRLGLEIAAL